MLALNQSVGVTPLALAGSCSWLASPDGSAGADFHPGLPSLVLAFAVDVFFNVLEDTCLRA